MDLDGDDVTLDTINGDISVVINRSMTLEGGSTLSVEGPGQVDIYVNGTTSGDDLTVTDSEVFALSNNATQLTVLGKKNFTGSVVDSSKYTGVIYAPTGEDGDSEVVIDRKGTVFGAVITGDMTLGRPSGGVGASVHFDTQLEDQQVVPPSLTIIPVILLHITENRISVSG